MKTKAVGAGIVALAVILGLVRPSGAWDEVRARIESGGAFRLEDEPRVLVDPQLYDANWNRLRVFGGRLGKESAGSGVLQPRSFTIVDGAAKPVVKGVFSCDLVRDNSGTSAATGRFKWEFEVLRDFDGKTFCVNMELPYGVLGPQGLDVRCGGCVSGAKEKDISCATTSETERIWIGGATCTDVRFRLAGGDVALVSAAPLAFNIQDNARWGQKSFSVRISLGDGNLKKGERRSLAFDIVGFGAFAGEGPTVIEPDGTWVPMKDSTAIVPGSALDFSRQGWIDAPAGKYGRVVARGSHFEFEKKPGVPQRFYGVNLCFTGNYMSESTADELCARLARLGYNAVRIHHFERELCEPKDGTTIRPAKMAELDNLLNACIRHGLYLTTDLYVSREVPWRSCGIDRDGVVPMDRFKELVQFHDGAYRNHLDFSRAFLSHVNPKTGRRWADEPALAFLAFVNEGNLGNYGYGFLKEIPEAGEAWESWLAAKKSAAPETYALLASGLPGNPWENTPRNAAFCVFLAEREIAFAEKMTRFIREEIGSGVLLSNLSCWKNPVQFQLPRTRFDYVDDHFYVDHPQFLERDWQLPSKCPNANPVKGGNSGFQSVFQHRLLDKPFTVTEFNYSGPGQYRGVGGLLFGAQAALQDYDGVWRFAWSHSSEGLLEPTRMTYFDVARDPLQRATERAALMLYLRRDIRPLKKSFAIVLPESGLRREFVRGPQLDMNDGWFGWYARLGTLVREDGPADASWFGLFPSVCSNTTGYYRGLVGDARPGDGQVSIDSDAGTFAVDTPRTRGFFSESFEKDGPEVAGGLAVRIHDAPTALWVSALDAAPIDTSKRLLLTHVTDVQDSGTVYEDSRKRVLLAWGGLPHLMRKARADVALTLKGDSPCAVYALHADGSRAAEVPCVFADGVLRFTVDTARDPDEATCFYEIVR